MDVFDKKINQIVLSVIIVNYQTGELLLNCIKSIYENNTIPTLQIIIVDNNSSDESISLVRKHFNGIKFILNDQNLGFAKANNQGLQVAQGEFILLLNPDTLILPQTLERSVEFLKNTSDAGVVGCKILNPDGSLQPSCKSFPGLWNHLFESTFLYKLFPKNRLFGKFYMTNFDYAEVKEVDMVIGAFLMTRKKYLEEICGLDERFFIYSEETDLCYRIRKTGRQVYFIPQAQIIHWSGKSTSQDPIEMFQQDHKSRYLFMKKHYKLTTVIFSELIIFVGVGLRMIIWGWLFLLQFFFKRPGQKEACLKFEIFYNLFKWYLGLGFLKR